MNKLTIVEAMRVMAILDDTIDSVERFFSVNPIVYAEPEKVEDWVDNQMLGLLEKHADMGNTFMDKLDSIEEDAIQNDSDPDANKQQDLEIHAAAMRRTIRDLARAYKHNTSVLSRLSALELGVEDEQVINDELNIKSDASSNVEKFPRVDKFIMAIKALRDITHRNLCTSIEEERAQEAYFKELETREEKMVGEVKMVNKDVQSLKMERQKVMSAKNETIDKLQKELEELRKPLDRKGDDSEDEDEEDSEEEEDDGDKEETFADREARLLDDLRKKRDEYSALVEANREDEEHERKAANRRETEVEEWVKKYDDEMTAKDSEFHSETELYTQEKKQLAYYDEYFERCRIEEEKQKAEEKRLAAIRAREEEKKRRLDWAAAKMQALWKGLKCRREYEKQRKGMSRGGKKGGAKGKKK